MYERLDKLREDVKRAEKRKQDAENKLRILQAKLKEAENSQILSDVGALNLTPEQVGKFLQMIKSGTMPDPETVKRLQEESAGNNVEADVASYDAADFARTEGRSSENDEDEFRYASDAGASGEEDFADE